MNRHARNTAATSPIRSFGWAAAVCLAFPLASMAQGIPMSPDFLPLQIGNAWNYQIEDEAGRVTAFSLEILDHQIVEGLSLYIFSRMPFVRNGTFDDPIGVHFDHRQRQYVFTNGLEQDVLFPARGQGAEVVETDAAGLPLVVELDYGDRTLRIERGVGITGGSLTYAGGRGVFTLVGARVGEDLVADTGRSPGLPALDVEAPVDNVVLPTDTAPVISLEAIAGDSAHRFVLRFENPTGKLMPFEFSTSQDFDFVVTDAVSGREVWRWAARRFFSQVSRSEAIRPGGAWTFEGEWNHTDREMNAVEAGTYEVRGILVSETPYESDPIDIEVR